LLKYVQRYHAKNESIGFFGPVGWARWDDAEGGLAVAGRHGEITHRRAQFEIWAVRALADTFAADPDTRPCLVPVRAPAVRIRDGRVYSPLRGWSAMPRPRFDVLEACSGRETVAELTARLLAAGVPGLDCAADVERQLAVLERSGQITVALHVPPTFHADRFLERQLAAFPDAAVRERHTTVLSGLQAAADRVRAAAGDPGRLAPALADLDRRFTDATGADARRGSAYAGRALLVEDCRSAVTAALGTRMRADLAGPLELVLASSRWLIDRVGAHYLALAEDIHDRLSRPDRPGVGLAAVLSELAPRFAVEAVGSETAGVVTEFQRIWAEILAVPGDACRHRVSADAIADLAHKRFD
ncbi:lantibiotic dehydratase, partial [Lysinibacillus sp. NPDC056185]|uniref:lantibiotic dehydratase n=1 Tax=Lysinibacillus sp. NPDC056185 TaxID=3345739 RepID=UPI0039EE6B16